MPSFLLTSDRPSLAMSLGLVCWTVFASVPFSGTATEPQECGIREVRPSTGGPGDRIRIVGGGFGGVPENLTVGIPQPDGGMIALRVLDATEHEIEAELGPVPESARPGRLIVFLGSGTRWTPAVPGTVPIRWVIRRTEIGSRHPTDAGGVSSGTLETWLPEPQPVDPRWAEVGGANPPLRLEHEDVSVMGEVRGWRQAGLPTAQAPADFTASSGRIPAGESWNLGRLEEGRLSVRIDGNWPAPAMVSIHARVEIETATGSVAHEVRLSRVVLGGEGSAATHAARIADVIEAAFAQRAGLAVECTVGDAAANEAVIHLALAGQPVSAGALSIVVDRPKVLLGVPRMVRGAGEQADRVRFSVETLKGRTYRVQINDGFQPSGWKDFSRVEGVGGAVQVDDPGMGSAVRIYRVIEE